MAIRPDTPIQFLKGVGPRLGDILRKRGVSTVGELLHWYPRAYEDRRAARSIASLRPGEIVSLQANVVAVKSYNLGRSRRKIYDVTIKDESGMINCKFFRVPYKGYFERFQEGQTVRVVGKAQLYRSRMEFHHPELKDIEGESADDQDVVVPIYTETEGISATKVRKLMGLAIENLIDSPEAPRPDWARKENGKAPDEEIEPIERLPEWLLKKYQLPTMLESLKMIHKPEGEVDPKFAELKSIYHQRIIFEEFFWMELFIATRKKGLQLEKAKPLNQGSKRMADAISQLPFQLTGAQERVLNEVLRDVKQPHPMHRLVQGDVGSGKTMVAMLSGIHAIDNEAQVAMMAPTEILAEQHFKNAKKTLEPLGIKVALLTGTMKAKEKEEIVNQLKSGEIDFCVGTHALIQDNVAFKNLGLVIVDEQHRFGVHQRGSLKGKGIHPHFMVMTATPIPRTLAMTVYGDLEVSIIDEMPAGRIPIVTRVVYESKRRQVMGFLNDQIKKGRQAYIIYPLVEESEKIDLKDAMSAYKQLTVDWPDIRFGLLHGRMKAEEKDQVMQHFRDHHIDVLVSTTVVEVGVDVPNANMILIEHTERFGLSQLHQLRGRVGRGEHKSYCVLMHGNAVSEEGRERAQVMARTNDGFEISEADLELRGPGEFMGSRQSGLPGFRMANLVRDVGILTKAREAAFEVLSKDASLSAYEHRYLKDEMASQRGQTANASIG